MMLQLNERYIYMDALRPPAGYTFDRAIGTTYSLDLTTLLIVPFSFALLDCESASTALDDAVKSLQALRRYADKITVFCQKGQISIPRHQSSLYMMLEGSVIQVQPRTGGVFHPKVWAIRYTAARMPVLYRLLVLTRNLTFDASWDTALVLDGELKDKAVRKNSPLRSFISFLPEIADSGLLSDRILEDIALVGSELKRVDFSPPVPFTAVSAFEPIGIPRYRKNPIDDKFSRLLVVSPFIDDEIQRLAGMSTRSVLVSRIDSLNAVGKETLACFDRVHHIMHDVHDVMNADECAEDTGQLATNRLADLHAKLYLAEKDSSTELWTGSANATRAAFSKNIEFLVHLCAPKSAISVDSLLAKTRDKIPRYFGDMLDDYKFEDNCQDVDLAAEEEKRQLERMKRKLTELDLQLHVHKLEADSYTLSLDVTEAVSSIFGSKVQLKCWPITLKENASQVYCGEDECSSMVFSQLSYSALTTFIAFEISLRNKKAPPQRFVLNLPCTDMPAGRHEAIIPEVITDPRAFLRFLLLLLSTDCPGAAEALAWWPSGSSKENDWKQFTEEGFPVIEELVRVLSRAPERLEELAEIISGIEKSGNTAVLPEEWKTLWKPFEEWLVMRRKS